MKNYKKTLLLILSTVMLAVISCNDYLEVPVNGTLTTDTFYQTDDDANAAMMAAYDMLTWNNNNWGWCAPVFVKTLPSDEGTCGGASANDQPDYNSLDKYSYDSGNSKIEGMWNLAYWGIYRCNLVIDNVEPNTDFKTQIIAEAYALRAYNYLDIAAFFGGGPLLTSTNIDPKEYDMARASTGELYAQIESDLAKAIADLPVKSSYSAADQFRMSKGTAQALLGKAKLYQEKYGEALTSFQDVISSMEYSLEPDFAKIFKAEGEFGSGSLFEAVFTSEVGYNWGTNPWDLGQSERNWEANMHIQLMGPREGEFGNTNDGIVEGWGFNYPTPKLAEAYDAAGDSIRKNATVMSEADYNAAGGEVQGGSFDYQGYVRLKYGSDPTESNDVSVAQNYGTNWRLLRYADVLLMAAEAAAKSNQEDVAHGYLNQVRTRAGLGDLNSSGAQLMTDIQNERFLELSFEGFRYIDLIRWGLAESVLAGEGFIAKHNLFPIPANELLKASNMTQNTGW